MSAPDATGPIRDLPSSGPLRGLIELALLAGREIMALYTGAPAAPRLKPDGSPVTDADLRAQAVILSGLARLHPRLPVIAEEDGAAVNIQDDPSTYFLVDPLDGTREFLARNGEFTVNIALIENGRPACGVVHAPALGQLYAGEDHAALACTVADHRIATTRPIHVRPAPPRRIALVSRSHGGAPSADWTARHGVAETRRMGSSLKFCRLAEGSADLYPRFGPTMHWDTAAGQAVLEAAGGCVLASDGQPLAYGWDSSAQGRRRNPSFVAYGDPRLTGPTDHG